MKNLLIRYYHHWLGVAMQNMNIPYILIRIEKENFKCESFIEIYYLNYSSLGCLVIGLTQQPKTLTYKINENYKVFNKHL